MYKPVNFMLLFPPTFYWKIWNYKKENTERFQKGISNLDSSEPFNNNNANENFKVLTDTFMNILRNYIS